MGEPRKELEVWQSIASGHHVQVNCCCDVPHKPPNCCKACRSAPEKQSPESRAVNLTPPFKFAGVLGAIGSAFMFSVGLFCVKLMPVEDVLQEKAKMTMIRGLLLMLLCGASILAQGSTLLVTRAEIPITLARSILGFIGTFGTFVTVQFITLAEAATLAYSSPLWTCILGHLILRERLPITLVAAFPLGALGILLIAYPDALSLSAWCDIGRERLAMMPDQRLGLSHSNQSIGSPSGVPIALDEALALGQQQQQQELRHRWTGMLIAILTSLTFAAVSICLKLRRTTPIQTTTFYLGLTIFLLSAVVQFFVGFGNWPASWLEWALHLAIGVCTFLTQTLLQWSLQYESAGTLSVVQTVEIVFSFMWSVVFLGESVLWTSTLGAALIALVVALIMLNNQIHRRLSACLGPPASGAQVDSGATKHGKQQQG